VTRKPQMLNLTQVSEWDQGDFRRKDDFLAAEEPLEIRIGAEPLSVTMRTPGYDLELAAGFLFTEGIISSRDQIISLQPGASGQDGSNPGNLVQVELVPEVVPDFAKTQRHFFAASSCGICGKASIDSVRSRLLKAPNRDFRCVPKLLLGLPDALRSSQDVFQRTGGLHAAALFDSAGALQVLREDIGRHNAVDKVIGWALMAGHLPLANSVLLVSGRGGFEIIQKAIVAGVPVVASVSAPSGLAVQLARELRLTLIGFLRGQRFVIYSGEERIVKSKDGGER
jgi:FdhD protein